MPDEKPASRWERGAGEQGLQGFENFEALPRNTAPSQIHAQLSGSDTAEAFGYSVTSTSPVLALCRDLVDAECPSCWSMEAYRGPTLCLRIRSIGEAARLEVGPHGVGFIACPREDEGVSSGFGGSPAMEAAE
jgi:hypothetical protein